MSISFDEALQAFFDNNLAVGMCYGSWRTPSPGPANSTLLYRDGTACSYYHAFSDVYQNNEGKYTLITDCSRGDASKECSNLEEVLLELASFSYIDHNSTGSMLLQLHTGPPIGRYECPTQEQIDNIKNNPTAIQRLHEESKRGEFMYNSLPLIVI